MSHDHFIKQLFCFHISTIHLVFLLYARFFFLHFSSFFSEEFDMLIEFLEVENLRSFLHFIVFTFKLCEKPQVSQVCQILGRHLSFKSHWFFCLLAYFSRPRAKYMPHSFQAMQSQLNPFNAIGNFGCHLNFT